MYMYMHMCVYIYIYNILLRYGRERPEVWGKPVTYIKTKEL